MAEVRWLRIARDDLHQIHRYIARDSDPRASTMVERIRTRVDQLRDFPERGRVVPEYADIPLREVIVPPYRVVGRFRPERDLVQVLAVARGSQMLPSLDPDG